MKILPKPLAFVWDKGNIDKNFKSHKVTNKESEEVFENNPRFLLEDEKHSTDIEKRYMLWGESDYKRKLTIIFTIRENKIRVISARDMHMTERRRYEELKTNS
jgi:uncharacterized DUF497 family protein